MSFNSEMTSLADAIRVKSGVEGKLTISGMKEAVDGIEINQGVDIDFSGVNVTADKMLSGIVAVGATGEKVSGNIQTVTATSDGTTVTVPVGYIAEQQTFPVGGDAPAGAGSFDLAKVTKYTPATPEMSGISRIVVSGLSGDYSSANGTYNVTAETEKADVFDRIYKHSSGNWYIWGEYDPDYEEGYWYIGVAPNSGDLSTWTSDEFSTGEYYFENWDTGDYFDVLLSVTKTTYPESPTIVKGVMAKRYDIDENAWVIGSSEIVLDGVLNTPEVGGLYVIVNGHTVGMAITSDSEAAIPAGFTSNTSIPGYVVNQSHGGGSYPDAYVVFNHRETEGDYAWYSGDLGGISASNSCWFSIEVPEAFVPSGIYIMNEIQSPQNFQTAIFQGSNNGSSWENLYTIEGSPDKTGYRQTHHFACNTAYKYFRMLFTASHASGVSVQSFQIYKNSFIVE